MGPGSSSWARKRVRGYRLHVIGDRPGWRVAVGPRVLLSWPRVRSLWELPVEVVDHARLEAEAVSRSWVSRTVRTGGRSNPIRNHVPWPPPGSVAAASHRRGMFDPWAVAAPGCEAPEVVERLDWAWNLHVRPFQRSLVFPTVSTGRFFLTLVCQPSRLSSRSISATWVNFSSRQTDRPTRTWSSPISSS